MKFRGKNGFVMWFTLVLVVTLGAGGSIQKFV
jgi:hypothetical protein